MKKTELVIGKYTLESLTNGMYASPLDLYREYIQNAVDSIDEAIDQAIGKKNEFEIDIIVDPAGRKITIHDNGKGLERRRASRRLVDVGNSKKDRRYLRGFRGIGRLAGLGYCDKMIFTTSCKGEDCATIVTYDAKELERILLAKNDDSESANDVLESVITIDHKQEKVNKHYFEVELVGVESADKLLDVDAVKEYLIQHAPLRYDVHFTWQKYIVNKFKTLGYVIPSYNVKLNGEELFKPYADSFYSDRVKRNEDTIKDIEVIPFYNNKKISAILWCAKTSYYGTILDNKIKGIRVRQGNIMIGDKMLCSSLFKEERFNGWLIGEIHVIDYGLIANARRDGFEKNDSYYSFVDSVMEWSARQSHEIRSVSYERSLDANKRSVVEAENCEDVNDLLAESVMNDQLISESDMIDHPESEGVAETDYIGKLAALINQKNVQTKYTALNINNKLTIEQRRVLERVFDVIVQEYSKKQADEFIDLIMKRF